MYVILFIDPYDNNPQVKLPFSLPHSPVQAYFNYLQTIYLRELHKTDPKWPPVQMNEYINLLWINKAGVFPHEGRVINEHIIQGDIDYVEGYKTKMTFADLANLKDGRQPQCIVVEGAPGSGKTMFSWEVCIHWAKGEILQQYSVLSLLQLRDPEVREASTIADLFPNSSADLHKEMADVHGKSCCILLDGFDELPKDKRREQSFFMKLLTGKLLPLATIIVTSRPWATNNFVRRYRQRISQHIEIVGFTRENVDTYVTQAFPEETERSAFQQYLKRYPYIRSVMYIPLNCAIVVEVFHESGSIEDAPKTLTQLYTELVKTALLRYLKCHPIYKDVTWHLGNDFKNNLPNDIYQQFLSLCLVAYEGIEKKQLVFSHLPADFECFDLMQKVEHIHISCGQSYSYNFLHLSIQEYLAAYHLSLIGSNQLQVELKVEKFLCGLTRTHNFIPVKLPWEKDDIHMLHCLYESQKTTFSEKSINYSITCSHEKRMLPSDVYVIGSYIALTKLQWGLVFEREFLSDEHFEMLCAGINAQNKVSCLIKALNLKRSYITSVSIDHFMTLPSSLWQSLTYLDLSHCNLGNEGCDKLADFIPLLSQLNSLKIQYNNITSGGHINLLKAVVSLPDFSLKLSSPNEEEYQLLASLKNLRVLTIRQTHLREQDSGVIVLIKENRSIEHLDVRDITLSENNVLRLAESLKENQIIQKLIIYISYMYIRQICDPRVKLPQGRREKSDREVPMYRCIASGKYSM